MGHMLNNTIQDVLIRRARLKGFNACWVPGTDHASIATEAKVAKLKAEGINKMISRRVLLMLGTGQINMEGLYLSNLKIRCFL
jgi:valyl-tRNA synthetase